MKYEKRKLSNNNIALKESLTPKNWWCSNTKHGNQIGGFLGGVVRILSYRQWVWGGLSKWKNKDGFRFSLLKLWHSTEITKKWRSKKRRGLWCVNPECSSWWKDPSGNVEKLKYVIVALLSYLPRDTPPNIPLSYIAKLFNLWSPVIPQRQKAGMNRHSPSSLSVGVVASSGHQRWATSTTQQWHLWQKQKCSGYFARQIQH